MAINKLVEKEEKLKYTNESPCRKGEKNTMKWIKMPNNFSTYEKLNEAINSNTPNIYQWLQLSHYISPNKVFFPKVIFQKEGTALQLNLYFWGRHQLFYSKY